MEGVQEGEVVALPEVVVEGEAPGDREGVGVGLEEALGHTRRLITWPPCSEKNTLPPYDCSTPRGVLTGASAASWGPATEEAVPVPTSVVTVAPLAPPSAVSCLMR